MTLVVQPKTCIGRFREQHSYWRATIAYQNGQMTLDNSRPYELKFPKIIRDNRVKWIENKGPALLLSLNSDERWNVRFEDFGITRELEDIGISKFQHSHYHRSSVHDSRLISLRSLGMNDPTERRYTMRHRPSLTNGLEFNDKSLDSKCEDPLK